ncbi:hypothetical protein C474_14454 [Halogeometricum pallidum JCM 14848]|uniref:Uncharacterized protein n=1 Tax=Halogeometricum pallidum JCM 14848 TaxID=1227487 RepID=M0CZR3_HALPD|nr:hypothetical protein C474_14454 [Halogeometricum pallidum JCM 14848]
MRDHWLHLFWIRVSDLRKDIDCIRANRLVLDVEQGTEHRNLIDECLWLCTCKLDAASRRSLSSLGIFERDPISDSILNPENSGWIIRRQLTETAKNERVVEGWSIE